MTKGDLNRKRAVLVRIAEDLTHLRTDAEAVAQPLLASLLEMAKSEAEDALRTAAKEFERASELKASSIAGEKP